MGPTGSQAMQFQVGAVGRQDGGHSAGRTARRGMEH